MTVTSHPVPSSEQVLDAAGRYRFPDGVGEAVAAELDEYRSGAAAEVLAAVQQEILAGTPSQFMLHEWPTPPTPLFQGVVAMSLIDEAERRYRERAVPDDVVADTLWDIGQQIDLYRQIHGGWGLDELGWLTHHLHGMIVKLGRLQFAVEDLWWDPRRPGLSKGDPTLAVHIPEQGPMAPAACNESFSRAGPFVARHYPEAEGWRAFTCFSWLLDPRLADVLSETSNIVRFQRRFEASPGMAIDSPDLVVKFVFHRVGADPSELPTDTTLRRVIVDRLLAGGTWRSVGGTILRPSP